MTRFFDPKLRPLTSEQLKPSPLPLQVQNQLREVAQIERKFARWKSNNPARGRPKSNRVQKSQWAFVADSDNELDELLLALAVSIGPRQRGNKRIGQSDFYAAVVREFAKLKRWGITLPRNKSLSSRACQHGLGDVLREYGITTCNDNVLAKNSKERQRIANRCDRSFTRVANALK